VRAENPRSDKGGETRAAIARAAQELFLERGYDATTMRAVADRAGVSVGNAYYYFESKQRLVQAFYDRVQDDHARASEPVLARRRTLASRLEGVLLAWVDVAEPYHSFAGTFFTTAADPRSPMSPFSEESRAARETSIGLHARVLDGSDARVPAALRDELPELLWLVQMAVVLFWVHDTSEGRRRTRSLVRRVAPLVARLVKVSRLPGMTGVVDDVLGVIRAARS